MTNKVFFVLAVLLFSGCSNDWSAGLVDKRTGSAAASSMEAPLPPILARGAGSFADAPDRGSLVRYPVNPVVRRSGAYTWHAADLSEEHALRSTITGNLSFTAPDGTPINLAYERHIEHPDGNWSWIGHALGERGESTVITFGEEAVFGTIPQARDQPPLRLTIADGRAWVVTADPRLLREIHNEATHPTEQDFLVPPKMAASTATTHGGIEAMGAQAMATTASAKTVVDILVGFTNGYATYRGGASAAITRIHNLVEVTNQAYRNSQVNAEVRLVHSMQVSYTDATANQTALEEMTGFKAPSTRTTPASAFSGLRSARNQYGADLVVLLRRFQDPENDGCGIAWLIGGGLSGIDSSDEFFGYSVVSDGQDAGTDGKTYFCREETLAHELGHNMGSQHDRVTATDDGEVKEGLYPYSFGHKTGTGSGNFYTVMGYGDTGQTSYRVFSNPRTTFCSPAGGPLYPCGIADVTDNARSLGQAMPLVVKFRATVVPAAIARAHNDIDGDGRSDLIWHSDSWGKLVYWRMNGAVREGYTSRSLPSGYRVVATGDFNGDGRGDLLWENLARTGVWMWLAKSDGDFAAIYVTDYPSNYAIAGVEDIDGDGRSDIVWHSDRLGSLVYWRMNGSVREGYTSKNLPSGYRVIATGDFNGDGRGDLLWENLGKTGVWMWLAKSDGDFSAVYLTDYQSSYKIAGVEDIDGDGRSDIVWHSDSLGNLVYWRMNGSVREGYASNSLPSGYRVVTTGDFNGDGRGDLLWEDRSKTGVWMWLATSAGGFSRVYVTDYPSAYQLVP